MINIAHKQATMGSVIIRQVNGGHCGRVLVRGVEGTAITDDWRLIGGREANEQRDRPH